MLRKLLSLLSDAVTYGASSLVGQLIAFFLLPLYTRFLTPEDYGISGMLLVVTMIFGPLANLGMTNATFRQYSIVKDPDERRMILGTGLVSVVVTSLITLAYSQLFAGPIAEYIVGKSETVDLVRLSLLSAAIASVGAVPRVMLRASRKVRMVATLNIAAILFTALPTIWLVVVDQQGVRGVVLGILIGEICAAVASFFCTLGAFRLEFSRSLWKSMLSYGLPFVPHHLQAVGLIVFGQYMVREMLGLDEAGLYNVATKFAMPVSFVVTAVQNSWAAYKFQIHAEDENPTAFFRSTFTYYLAALTYLWVGVALWGPEVVRLMTGPNFHSAALLIWATGLVPVAQGVYYMSGTGMELSNNTRPFPLVSLAGLVTVVGSAMLLIPATGALGAALATAIGWGAMSAVMYYFAQRRLAIDYDWVTAAGFGLLAVGCVCVSYYTQSAPLPFRLATDIVISLLYPAIAFAMLLRSRDERHRMHLLLSKLKLAGGR